MLLELLQSFPPTISVMVVDNSPAPLLMPVTTAFPKVSYHHAGNNQGYGKGHNLALSLSPPSEFHLIVNPDIVITPGAIQKMLLFMDQHPNIGLLVPKVLNQDGTTQYLNRHYPTVLDLLLRHLPACLMTENLQERAQRHEMQDQGYESICEPECISGAFMLCRRSVLEKINGFDPRYFLYCEDFDLGLSVRAAGMRTVFYPDAAVVHRWARASSSDKRLMLIHLKSMVQFFNKWGWRWKGLED